MLSQRICRETYLIFFLFSFLLHFRISLSFSFSFFLMGCVAPLKTKQLSTMRKTIQSEQEKRNETNEIPIEQNEMKWKKTRKWWKMLASFYSFHWATVICCSTTCAYVLWVQERTFSWAMKAIVIVVTHLLQSEKTKSKMEMKNNEEKNPT